MLARVRAWLDARSARWVLVAGWLLFLACSYPGYLSFDSVQHMAEVRTGHFTDAHPAVMSVLWSLAEYVLAGPSSMLALQSGLFLFGLAALLRRYLAPRVAALTAIGVLMFPPVFSPMSVIWPQSMMAGALIAAAAALLVRDRRWQLAGGAALVLALSCRPEAIIAIIPIAALVVTDHRGWRRAALIAAIVTGTAATARIADRLLIDDRVYAWNQYLELVDVVGTLRRAHAGDADLDRALAGLPIADRTTLAGKLAAANDALDYFPLVNGDNRMFDPVTIEPEADALGAAWRRAIADHPRAYALHRWTIGKHLLGLSGSWRPVFSSFGSVDEFAVLHHHATPSDIEVGMQAISYALAATPLFRPWLYAILGAIALGLAWRRRELRALAASGLVLELTELGFAADPDYRTPHWLVATACIVLAALAVRRASLRKAA